jgi:hypothetical protein
MMFGEDGSRICVVYARMEMGSCGIREVCHVQNVEMCLCAN